MYLLIICVASVGFGALDLHPKSYTSAADGSAASLYRAQVWSDFDERSVVAHAA